jgi:hypothetical protein
LSTTKKRIPIYTRYSLTEYQGVLTFGMNERVFDGFCADPGAFCAAMPRISQKKQRRAARNGQKHAVLVKCPHA